MARGKETCRILKEIRKQIAEANDIEFIISECRYKGDCLGTCPKCEAEVRYLEQQLRARSLAGKAVTLAGISATALALSMPMTAEAQTLQDSATCTKGSIPITTTDTITIKGVVLSGDTLTDGAISKEPIIQAFIINQRTGNGTITDFDGKFALSACIGDQLEIRYIGYATQNIVVAKDMKDTVITLLPDMSTLQGEVMVIDFSKKKHYLDLNVFDEKGNRIGIDSLEIERIWIDENGEKNYEELSPGNYEEHPCHIDWDYDWGLQDENGKPLKEATLRITAEGYEEPITITVKRPKRHNQKTIRFKHKKQE